MEHLTHCADLGPPGMAELLRQAARLKAMPQSGLLAGQVLGMLFFNPSLRTRVSFETALLRNGGHAVVLNAGQDNWKLEGRTGVRMDGDRPEHLREAIPILSGYVDALAVRSFAGLADHSADEADGLIRQIRALSSVPVISMESAREHPCQSLADMLTIQEHCGELAGCRLTLSWAPHIKPLPLAVPHSFVLAAAACGADLCVAAPPGFELHPAVITEAQAYAAQSGARLEFTHDQEAACRRAEVVYAKSWGPLSEGATSDSLERNSQWMIDLPLLNLGPKPAKFMHCLPVRRNVEVADAVLDSTLSLAQATALNRYHVQVAVLDRLLNGGKNAS